MATRLSPGDGKRLVWYRYRDGRLKETATDWLKANEIPFTGDDTPASAPSADRS